VQWGIQDFEVGPMVGSSMGRIFPFHWDEVWGGKLLLKIENFCVEMVPSGAFCSIDNQCVEI